jgi:hypothetical protein
MRSRRTASLGPGDGERDLEVAIAPRDNRASAWGSPDVALRAALRSVPGGTEVRGRVDVGGLQFTAVCAGLGVLGLLCLALGISVDLPSRNGGATAVIPLLLLVVGVLAPIRLASFWFVVPDRTAELAALAADAVGADPGAVRWCTSDPSHPGDPGEAASGGRDEL